MTSSPTAAAYIDGLAARMGVLFAANERAIGLAAEAVAATAAKDGLVYLFGTGHSHLIAEEAHYRAGGLALTVPVLATATMLHEGAEASTTYERMPGMAGTILARYPVGDRDVLVVISNSGVNAVPVEAARFGKARGATVVALTSLAHSAAVAGGRESIAGIADIVLDNGAPPGDATVALPGTELRTGPISTSIGAALVNAVLAEAAARIAATGAAPPLYRSANLPGSAENNAALVSRYRPRNPHL